MIRIHFLLTLLFLGFASCDKIRANRFSGVYTCSVHATSFDMYGSNYDTTYTSEVEVVQDGTHILILGSSIHVDSLRHGNAYKVGSYLSYFELKLEQDSLFYLSSSGGLGGYSSITYRGEKIK
jgi:hypothetical protein